ncbi:MAG: hypothetical protein IH968_11260 [Gemmatimonadetes bacterium]|nr:hypothetical protein [Gemmatimonadota bacterium]
MKAHIVILTVSLALWVTACASPSATPFDQGGVSLGTIQVEVDNQNFNDATVYLQSGSGEQRLGIVRGKSVKTFVARLMGPYEVRLRVRLLAGGSFTTEAMHASPGETLLLIVPSSLR